MQVRLYKCAAKREPAAYTCNASTAIAAGTWVVLDGAGATTIAGTNGVVTKVADNGAAITGLAVSAAAVNAEVNVLVPMPGDIFAGPGNGTFVAADVGAAFNLHDEKTIDHTADTNKPCICYGFGTAADGTTQEVYYSISAAFLTTPGGTLAV